MKLMLYDWPASPFSLKVRAILEYKGLNYDRTSVIKPNNWLHVRRQGKVGKAPALEIDGQLVVDSTDIAYELERRCPQPAVIPDDPRHRALCHALEEWADESLYFVGLYYQWQDPAGRQMVPTAFGTGLFGRALYQFYLRRVLGQIAGQGTGRKPPEHVRSDLTRHLERLADLIQPGPFLLGEAPYLCDFALLGQLVYLGRTPVGGVALGEHAAVGRYLERLKGLKRPA